MTHAPERLQWLGGEPGGAEWLTRLPALVEALAQQWELDVAQPYPASFVAFVAPARRRGEPVVLKVQWPHRESEHEALALATWDGQGAVRLLAHDPAHHALLLEQCRPGTPLSATPGVAVDVLVGLLGRLSVPAGPPFASAAREAAGWAASLREGWERAGRPCEQRLVDAALDVLDDLVTEPEVPVLVHLDLHGDNVLAAEREPWLVIDPKPVAGERELAVAPVVRSPELGHSRTAVRHRLRRLCDDLGLDRERARAWTIAQTMAWSFDGSAPPTHHDVVRWLLDG
jgi:streptomycin 6-kinase